MVKIWMTQKCLHFLSEAAVWTDHRKLLHVYLVPFLRYSELCWKSQDLMPSLIFSISHFDRIQARYGWHTLGHSNSIYHYSIAWLHGKTLLHKSKHITCWRQSNSLCQQRHQSTNGNWKHWPQPSKISLYWLHRFHLSPDFWRPCHY